MRKLSIRGFDKFGCGAFGASRDGGTRTHKGVDIITRDGEPFYSLNEGTVTKLGYVYKGSYTFRYVQVTDKDGAAWRYHYLTPTVELGLKIKVGQEIGTSQSLEKKYPGITPHCHFEVMKNGFFVDPTKYVQPE